MTAAKKALKPPPPAATAADAPRRLGARRMRFSIHIEKGLTGWIVEVHDYSPIAFETIGIYRTRNGFVDFDAVLTWLGQQPVPAEGAGA